MTKSFLSPHAPASLTPDFGKGCNPRRVNRQGTYPYYRAKSLWLQIEMYPDEPKEVEAHMRDFDDL